MNAAIPPGCRFLVDQAGDDLVIRRRLGSTAAAAGLLLWLSFWTVACVMLVARVWREPTIEHAAFSLPFLVGWAVGLAFFLTMLLGFERLRVGPGGLEHRTLMGRRLVPLGEVRGLGDSRKVIRDDDGERIEVGLMVETAGRPIRFGRGLDEPGRRWLIERLLGQLRALAPGQPIEHHPGKAAKAGLRIEYLGPDRPVPGPPSDCTVRLRDRDRDGAEFARRGTFSPGGLGTATALNFFWNGGVALFAIKLLEDFEWAGFLLFLPFAAIGLLFFSCWVAALLAPFMAERLAIGPREVSSRSSCLGLGRARHLDAAEIARVEVEWAPTDPDKEDDAPCSLRLVGGDGRALVGWSGLTEGEARWVGGLACEMLKGSLPGPGRWGPSHGDGDASLWDQEIDG